MFQKQESGLTDTYLYRKIRKGLKKHKVRNDTTMYQAMMNNIFFNIGKLTLIMIRYCIATYESFITAKTKGHRGISLLVLQKSCLDLVEQKSDVWMRKTQFGCWDAMVLDVRRNVLS